MDRSGGALTQPLLQQLALAEHHLATGSPERAAAVLDRLAPDALDEPRFWLLRGQAARQAGDTEGAIRAAIEGLAREPQSVPLLILLGEERARQGDLPGAEEALLAALSVAPEDVEALCAYAHASAQAGQIEKALRLVERAAAQEPDSFVVLATRYQIAHLVGDDQETARLAQQIAEVSEGDPHAIALLGLEAAKRNDARESQALLERAAGEDVRVVDTLGAETFYEARALNHPLMWPLWPIQRWGPGQVWMGAVGVLVGLRLLGRPELLAIFAVSWLSYVAYSWAVPPFVRWWVRR